MSSSPAPADPAAPASTRNQALIEFILAPDRDLPRVAQPTVIYLIASQPRTGSNLLCSLLTQSGVAGRPVEYLHLQAMPAVMARRGFADIDIYLADLMTRRTTPNGVFGIKAHYLQFAHFLKHSRAALPCSLRIVRLFRRDVVAQAISFYLATRTGVWFSADGTVRDAESVPYDFALISRAVGALLKERNDWTLHCRKSGIAPRAMAYETLVADPPAAALRVLDWLGIEADPAALRNAALTPKQSTGRNAEWAARFRAELEARGLPPP